METRDNYYCVCSFDHAGRNCEEGEQYFIHHLSVYLPIYLSIHLSIHLLSYPSSSILQYLSTHL